MTSKTSVEHSRLRHVSKTFGQDYCSLWIAQPAGDRLYGFDAYPFIHLADLACINLDDIFATPPTVAKHDKRLLALPWAEGQREIEVHMIICKSILTWHDTQPRDA